MEFLLFPFVGLILGTAIFLVSNAQTRRFSFYIFWLVGVICFVMAALTYLVAPPQDRMSGVLAPHLILALVGYIGIVVAALFAHGHERRILYSRIIEERQHRAASEITQLAASSSALMELLNFALDKIIGMLGLSGGAIHVFHRARENLVLGSYMGLSARLARRLETIEFGDTAIGRTAKNKRLLIIRDLRLSQDYEFFGGKQEGFSYMALIPITSEGENWGVISLFGKGSYQPGSLQVDLLEQFGEQLGAALVLGRQVRNMQAARENLSYLMKTLGQELSEISMAKAGLGSVRGIAWAVTRFFGGDRFDLCARDNDNWRIVLSSETADEGKAVHSSYDFASGPYAGHIEPGQQAPFAEFSQDKPYVYTSLHIGREWLFIRLESRRRAAIDLELLTDSFRIINGLYNKFAEFSKQITQAKNISRQIPDTKRAFKTDQMAGIAADLDRLIKQYSDFHQKPEMQELFVWLESIQKSAQSGLKVDSLTPRPQDAGREESLNLDNIIQGAIKSVARQDDGYPQIVYENAGDIPASSIPKEELHRALLEFLTAALFNANSNGSIKLFARGENKSVIFEIQGTELSQTPLTGERPRWLRQIDGRLEARRIETDQGQSIDTWRLSIPLRDRQESVTPSERPLRVLAIDSQDIIRELLSNMLIRLGYEASVVGNVGDARELFKAGLSQGAPYSIVIADYSLEKNNEPRLALDLKSLHADMRFILLTSWGLTIEPEDASRMGVDFILSKPFRMEQLADAIGNVAVPSGPQT